MGCSKSVPVILPRVEIQKDRFDTNYELKEKLVRGSITQVRRCVHKNTRHDVAVKILKTSSSQKCKKAMRELDVWKQVGSHENVVVLLDSYVESGVHYFVMQRCHCTIDEKLNIGGANDEKVNMGGSKLSHIDLLEGFAQVFLGLAHCHFRNIVHRDIRPENILVDVNDIVKIADFSLAIPMPEKGKISGVAGFAPFMSPEMVKGRPYGFETDVWSCGAVIYLFAYGSNAYETTSSSSALSLHEKRRLMTKAIASNKPRPAYKPKPGRQHPSNFVCDLIETLLDRNVRTRPKASDCAKLIYKTKGISPKKRKRRAPSEPQSQVVHQGLEPDDINFSIVDASPTDSEMTGCSTDINSRSSSQSLVLFEEELGSESEAEI